MDIHEYFSELDKNFERAFSVATEAKKKGYDPESFVEILPAPDLATRVEGIIGIKGLSELIKKNSEGKSRQELAFTMVKEVCTNERFNDDIDKRLSLATKVGLAVLTEGILVAPTEGLQGIELHRNQDGTDYAAIIYAGPIRGAGGTAAALSVALADYGRRILGIGAYKATKAEIDRYLEEIQIYNSRVARLQYLPPEQDIRTIFENCPVCLDGLASEQIEIGIHRNINRLDAAGKPQMISNKIRSGICLVSCEGIAQKAKSVLKYTKGAGLDWSWLNQIIRVEKSQQTEQKETKKDVVFLQELVAGRPIFAYPEHSGAFRLRYGRSRFTGIASKGFSPATMYLMDEFIATGTQLKVEKPGKGCVAVPVDTIEGPFVKLDTGEAFRIKDAEEARRLEPHIKKILSVGDMLVTYGDFKKTNTPLSPTSYVEEYWALQLKKAGCGEIPEISNFADALKLSEKYNVPMHPRFIYDYSDISTEDMLFLVEAFKEADLGEIETLDAISSVTISGERLAKARELLERACIPHIDKNESIDIEGETAKSLMASFGLVSNGRIAQNRELPEDALRAQSSLDMLNKLAKFKIMRRSTKVGGRMGRPEKARERLMKPAPHILFPIGEYGGKERSITKAYILQGKKFNSQSINVELARHLCTKGGEYINSFYCEEHKCRAEIMRKCKLCGNFGTGLKCEKCGGAMEGGEMKQINIVSEVNKAMERIGMTSLPKLMKGVKGLSNSDKLAEPLEKGLLRSVHKIYIFKDGTSRFDATDVPITHFYPDEISVSVESLKKLGYNKDYKGNPLERGDQLVELMHQDVILNRRGADYFVNVTQFMDEMLVKFYGLEKFYNVSEQKDLVGHYVITLSPHTSAGVLGRIIGFTDASVGFAHPYLISARRRNCDGDEDTTMMLLDALVNFSKHYMPTTVGGTMDAPLILTVNVKPEEVDDEVHAMEVVESYGIDFYDKTYSYPAPGEVKVEIVGDRLQKDSIYSGIRFTHLSGINAVAQAPKRSSYTTLKTMNDKIEMQFSLMDKLYSIDKRDTARRLILSHFIPDLMGNLHSYSRQGFRCVQCNAKYRRIPIKGVCTRCGGKLLLTISKGGIEKYLNTAIKLADRYELEPYIKQRILLLKEEIEAVFGQVGTIPIKDDKQFNLLKFM
ncbi:DNA polymerase II large subunit [Candidatus Marsarchaeota archaeon]|jgi:DNA polymerase II large subunit|nr:DNA polymerase II large subunit [Candidatus Marsarchaeota archaeon]